MPFRKFLVGIALAGALTAQAAQAQDGPHVVLFTGGDIADDSLFGYVGAIGAIGGDLGTNSFLVRGFAGYSDYDYKNGGAIGANNDGETFTADFMVGYQVVNGPVRIAGYAGVNYQDTDIDPADPANSTQGEEVGAKGQLEFNYDNGPGIVGNLSGSYSTAHNTYWVRARPGYQIDVFTLGPEGAVLGNDEFDQQRIGAFVSVNFDPVNVNVSGGFAARSGRSDSAYGSLGLAVVF